MCDLRFTLSSWSTKTTEWGQRQNECACSVSGAIWAFRVTALPLQTKLMRVFPLRQQSFSPKSFPSEESNKKCYELRRHVTDALLRSLNLQLLPQYFFCWVRYVTERNFSENGNFICFGLGLSLRNETKQWEFQNCPCWTTMVLLWKYWRSHSFTHMKFLVRYKHAHSFCRSVFLCVVQLPLFY